MTEQSHMPVEQLPITLFDSVVLAVRSPAGDIYLNTRDLCATLALNESSQLRRMRRNDLRLASFRVQDDRQVRTLTFLLIDDLSLWLLGVQAPKASEEARERLLYTRRYLESAVRRAFAQLAGLPDAPSQHIEDLRDLDQIDTALRQLESLGKRQETLEQSQDRARQVFRDMAATIRELQTRIQALEQQARTRLAPEQRGTIYQLVQQWGQARARHDSKLSEGAAIRRCWVEFNTRFDLATYADLPAARYDEAVQFISQHHHALTGAAPIAGEQRGMEL